MIHGFAIKANFVPFVDFATFLRGEKRGIIEDARLISIFFNFSSHPSVLSNDVHERGEKNRMRELHYWLNFRPVHDSQRLRSQK